MSEGRSKRVKQTVEIFNSYRQLVLISSGTFGTLSKPLCPTPPNVTVCSL
ncbi:unnamed protein product [Lupinus luteus]|uniref:Uncharacterized protein n=1 Tax=Lupinus luteus TaxID=3873 RepID=A0AAV1XT59_LUPLU